MNRRVAIQGSLAGMIGMTRASSAQEPAAGSEGAKLPEQPFQVARVMDARARLADDPSAPAWYQAGAFHPAGRLLITGEVYPGWGVDVSWSFLPGREPVLTSYGWEPTLSIWDVQIGRTVRSTGGHPAPIACICLDPEGKRILVGGEARRNLTSDPARRHLPFKQTRPTPIGPLGGAMRAYDLATGDLLETYPRGDSPVVAVHWGSHAIGALDLENVFSVRPPGRREPSLKLTVVKGPGQKFQSGSNVGFSADGDRAVAISNKVQDMMRAEQIGSIIFLWDALHGYSRERITSGADVRGIALAPAGTTLATADKGGRVQLRGFDDFEVIRDLAAVPPHGPAHLAFDPAGRRLVAVSSAGDVFVWDVADGRLIASGKGPGGFVLASVFLAKQVRFATAEPHPDRPAPAQQLQVWDLAFG